MKRILAFRDRASPAPRQNSAGAAPSDRSAIGTLATEVEVAKRKLEAFDAAGSNAESQVDSLIMTTSGVCAGLACLPNPIPDFFVLTPIQVIMALKIAQIRGYDLSRGDAQEFLITVTKCLGFGYIAQQGILSAYRYFIPFLGPVTTVPMVFAATYGIGKVVDLILKEGPQGTKWLVGELKPDPERIKREFEKARLEGQRRGSHR
jgi:uncharacterized protein (DUF697 family)